LIKSEFLLTKVYQQKVSIKYRPINNIKYQYYNICWGSESVFTNLGDCKVNCQL